MRRHKYLFFTGKFPKTPPPPPPPPPPPSSSSVFTHKHTHTSMPPESRPPVSRRNAETVLRVSEYFLRNRDPERCKKYALQAQQSDPNLAGIPQILAVADVLLASHSPISETHFNYYSILNLNPFSNDTNLLKDNFINLISVLSPNKNRYSFADEALTLVRNAWNVLSDPFKKAQFDDLLKRNGFEKAGGNLDTFWTVCPYCCYVYEYEKVYEDCCLRCWNENCGKGFHGLVINSPPDDVLMAGNYLCSGFFRAGDNSGSSSWTPFALKKQNQEGGGTVDNGSNVFGGDSFVEISDDSDDTLCDGDKSEVSSKEMDTGEMDVRPSVSKPVMRRKKKSVGRNTTKMTGTGFRVRKQNIVGQSGEELDSSKEGSNGEEDMGLGFMEGMEMASGAEFVMADVNMEFFDGDDDIFVDVVGDI